MRRAGLLQRFVVTGMVALVVSSGRVAAHGGGGGPHAWFGPVGFLVGVAVAGVAVALDSRDAVARTYVDIGVFTGVGVALAGLVVYVVV
ncbi:hypothetical protein [Halorubellus litoreus]|uniref:Uncharacterized protein n=1 Tax=Halorubellus litoreus TaxID=755308 RepID=A0ABD5VDM0_9EURY